MEAEIHTLNHYIIEHSFEHANNITARLSQLSYGNLASANRGLRDYFSEDLKRLHTTHVSRQLECCRSIDNEISYVSTTTALRRGLNKLQAIISKTPTDVLSEIESLNYNLFDKIISTSPENIRLEREIVSKIFQACPNLTSIKHPLTPELISQLELNLDQYTTLHLSIELKEHDEKFTFLENLEKLSSLILDLSSTELEYSYATLDMLMENIRSLSSLRHLDLILGITIVSIKSLPQSITTLSIASDNDGEEIDWEDSPVLDKLKKLVLKWPCLEDIPASCFPNLDNLSIINTAADLDPKAIFRENRTFNIKKLTTLTLLRTGFTNIHQLAELLTECQAITHLTIGDTLEPESQRLKDRKFFNNHDLRFFKNMRTLTSLSLRYCFDPRSEDLLGHITLNCQELKYLSLNNSDEYNEYPALSPKQVHDLKTLLEKRALIGLDLSGWKLTDEDIKTIFERPKLALTKLILDDCTFTNKGLSQIIKMCPNLEWLVLPDNIDITENQDIESLNRLILLSNLNVPVEKLKSIITKFPKLKCVYGACHQLNQLDGITTIQSIGYTYLVDMEKSPEENKELYGRY